MGTTKKPAAAQNVTLTLSHEQATSLLTMLTHALQHGGTKTAARPAVRPK
jgi:hypothetical protein